MNPPLIARPTADMNPIALSLQDLKGNASFRLENDVVLRPGAGADIHHVGTSDNGGRFTQKATMNPAFIAFEIPKEHPLTLGADNVHRV